MPRRDRRAVPFLRPGGYANASTGPLRLVKRRMQALA